MTTERLAEIEQFTRRYGSANCWTGTLGTACTYIRELLAELKPQKQWQFTGNGDGFSRDDPNNWGQE